MTLTRTQVLHILGEEGITPSRALGQNFVTDPNTVRRIARLAQIGSGDKVVEIGAGLGSLTLALAETGARVVAVEKDRRLVPILRRVVNGYGAVRIVQGDALELDWNSELEGRGWILVANLPYNVATPLVIEVLESLPQVARMLVMVQREVGERLAASPRGSAYGAVSVKVAYWALAKCVGSVPASVFLPRPRVESVLVSIQRRSEPAVAPEEVDYGELCRVVELAFATRRKMLRGALSKLCDAGDFERAGVAPTARAEELSVEDFGRLASAAR